MGLILTTLEELGPMQNIDLTNALLKRGWETASTSPSNTVRTALGRLMERQEVIRLDDGRFAKAPDGQPEATAEDTSEELQFE